MKLQTTYTSLLVNFDLTLKFVWKFVTCKNLHVLLSLGELMYHYTEED